MMRLRCVAVLLFVLCHVAQAGAEALGTGGIDFWADRPLRLYRPAIKPIKGAPPTRVINHEYLPTVRSQGSEPSCHYWAMGYYYRTWQEAKEHGWVHPDPEANPEQVMHHWFSYRNKQPDLVSGCPTYATMGAGPNDHGWPTREQWEDALPHRPAGFAAIDTGTPQGLSDLKAHLASGDLAYIGMLVKHNFVYVYPDDGAGINNEVLYEMVGDPYDPPGAESSASHALTLIGYDDNKAYMADGVAKQGAFVAVNSWGTDFGVSLPEVGTGGFIWLGYDFVQTSVGNPTIMLDQPSVVPEDLAVIEMDHQRMLEVSAILYGGDPAEPDWQLTLPMPTGNFSLISRMVFDISDFPVQDTGSFSLRISDIDVGMIPNMIPPSYTGQVKYFAIERGDSETPWECRTVPANTRDRDVADPNPENYLWLEASLFEKRTEPYALPEIGRGDFCPGFFNEDDWPDLLVSSKYFYGDAFTRLLENDGAGNFIEKTAGLPDKMGPFACADFNNDGRLDLILAPEYETTFEFYLYSAAQESFVPRSCSLSLADCIQVDAVDVNRDGFMDISALADTYEDGMPLDLKIWLGDGSGQFSEWSHGISYFGDVELGRGMVWNDFNADGWPDLAVDGSKMVDQGGWPFLQPYLVVFTNQNGTGLVETWRFELSELRGFSDGDFNADGQPDLLVLQYDDTIILQNDGSGGFTEIPTNLPVFYKAEIDVADFDNDGLADVALSGELDETDTLGLIGHCGLYRNKGGGQFARYNGASPDMDKGVARLVDVDGDMDLDLVVQGDESSDELYGLHVFPCFEVYLNGTAQPDRLNRPNVPPSVPGNISTRVSDGDLLIEWDTATDDATAQAALCYHLAVEKFYGWNDIVSGARTLDGSGANMQGGHVSGGRGAVLQPAPTGDVEVRVRAVDGARAASGWSEPVRISGSGESDAWDINQDAKVDAADLVVAQRVRAGVEADPGKTARADLNADGQVNGLDTALIATRLLDEAAPSDDMIDSFVVGPEGGRIISNGVALDIPPGAFGEAREIRVHQNDLDLPTSGEFISPMFRIEGLPEYLGAPLTVEIQPTGSPNGDVFLAHGMNVWRSEGFGIGRAIQTIEPKGMINGWYLFTLDTPMMSQIGMRSSTPRYQFESETNWLGLQTGITILESAHFAIHYPLTADTGSVVDMADVLETAYTQLHGTGSRGFDPARLPSGRMKVYVEEMKASYYGYASDWPGRNADTLHINLSEVQPGRAYDATASHEFMHLVIAGYPPASISLSNTWDTYWADEATAVWFEYNQHGVPTVFYNNMQAPFTGMLAGARDFFSPSDKTKQNHGYGMSSLFAYWTEKKGLTTFPSLFWNNVRLDYSMPECVRRAASQTDYLWYTDYLETLMQDNLIMPMRYEKARDIAGERVCDLSKISQGTVQDWGGYLPSLSANLHMTHVNEPGLSPSAKISHRLALADDLDLSVLQMLAPTGALPDQTTLLGRGLQANNALKFDAPIGSLDSSAGYKIFGLVTNRNGNVTDAKQYYSLMSAVTEDKTWALPSYQVYGPFEQNYPVLTVVSSISGPGLAQVQNIELTQGMVLFQALALGMPPASYDISVSAVVTVGEWENPILGTPYRVDGISSYEMDYYTETGATGGESEKFSSSSDGSFTVDLSVTSQIISGSVAAVIDVVYADSGNHYETVTQPIFAFVLLP